jgi:hypothetical protein
MYKGVELLLKCNKLNYIRPLFMQHVYFSCSSNSSLNSLKSLKSFNSKLKYFSTTNQCNDSNGSNGSNGNNSNNDNKRTQYCKYPHSTAVILVSSSLIASGTTILDDENTNMSSLGTVNFFGGIVGFIANGVFEAYSIYPGVPFGPGLGLCVCGACFGYITTNIFIN